MGFLRTLSIRLAHFDVLRGATGGTGSSGTGPHEPPFSRVLSSMQSRRPGSPLEGDHRCGTAPGSHRTSLALHHRAISRAGSTYESAREPVKPADLNRYLGVVSCWCGAFVPKEQRSRRVLDDEQVCHAISGSANRPMWPRGRASLPCSVIRAGSPSVGDPPCGADKRHGSGRRSRYA